MKPIIVGEAPSAQGDGRPFTGPSGERLQALLGLESYDQLTERFELMNLFEIQSPVWDRFDQEYARKKAMRQMTKWVNQEDLVDVILAGRKVARAFRVEPLAWFVFEMRANVVLWTFPHPSGLNHFWNDPEAERDASRFLRARAIGASAHHPSGHIPLNQHTPQAR